MILPQTQGSIYLYQAFVDPYLSQHEHDIDKALKDIKKQAMAMGMQYVKQAIQMMQNLAFDLYNKSQSQAGDAPLADKDAASQASSAYSAPGISSFSANSSGSTAHHDTAAQPAAETNANHPSVQGYLSWAYHALSPKLAAVATMASETASRQIPSRPLPVPPVNLYAHRTGSTSSTGSSSREPSVSGAPSENIFGINSSAASASLSASDKAELARLSSRLSHAAESTAMADRTGGSSSLRNRKISLYEDDSGSGSEAPLTNHSTHASESHSSNSWSGYAGYSGPAPAYTPSAPPAPPS